MHRLSIIGGGRMGDALLGGLIQAGWARPDELSVVEAVAARRDELTRLRPGVAVLAEPAGADGVIVAVKPGDVDVATRAAVASGARRVLSIAAGVSIAQLEAAAGDGVTVVRAMPNTPALVGKGASAIAGGTHATGDDLGWAESILGAVGTVVRVTEPQLDAVTGLSGSGPAYVFLVVEAMIEAGVLVGLPRDTASALATQTVLGAATLLADSDEGPEALRAAVTSPGGTTAAGLRALESAGVRSAVIDAVVAATERARELGGS
ncbi:MAG: pyrroline-5-carboxylate reductase [Acidimicrobiia bacterium]|nr:pyrroline-5-carboxylate reductase [Acidimicrobiia bacterium]